MPDAKVEIIKAKEKIYLSDESDKAVSVCAYCRVSTDKNDQRNSFDSQKRFFEAEFERHSNWTGKTVFADQGISGTSLKNRSEFNRMISLALQGRYQLIITKEVSRFSRNVQDILNITSELKNQEIYIYFLTDDINTQSPDYREQLIKSAEQAEMESRKTSKRVRWGQRRQMEQGVVFGRREMLGYNINRDANGSQHFEIISEEAELIRRIFTMYSGGMGTFKIARQLELEGIKTKRYSKGWSNTVILRILRNEKYVGDLMTGKTYTPDCLDHKKKYNRQDSPAVYIKDHHPNEAIVDRDLWDSVQRLLKGNEPSDEIKAKHSNRYWVSGKIVCGECGQRYVSHQKKRKDGSLYKSWKCFESQSHGQKKELTLETGEKVTVGCNSQSVNDKVIYQAMCDIISIMGDNADDIMRELEETFQKELQDAKEKDSSGEVVKLKAEAEKHSEMLTNLTLKYATGEISEFAYKATAKKAEEQYNEINEKISALSSGESREQDLINEHKRKCDAIKRITELKDAKFNEELFRQLLDRIEVYNEHILKFYLSFLDKPITLQYRTRGKRESFEIEFDFVESL